MNRRNLLQLSAGLIFGDPAQRAYSFLTNNPLAKSPFLVLWDSGMTWESGIYEDRIHATAEAFALLSDTASSNPLVRWMSFDGQNKQEGGFDPSGFPMPPIDKFCFRGELEKKR